MLNHKVGCSQLNEINQETDKNLSESLFHLAIALVNLGDLQAASEKIDESIKICKDSKDQKQLCQSLSNFIQTLEKQDRSIEISKIIQKYRNLADELDCNSSKDKSIVKVSNKQSRKAKHQLILKNKTSRLS